MMDTPVVLLQTSKEIHFAASNGVRFSDLAFISKAILSIVAIALGLFLLWCSTIGLPDFKGRQAERPRDEMSNSVLLVLALTMGLDYYSTDQYQSSMPNMAVEFDVSQAAMGMSILIHTVVLSVALLFAGPLSDRLGRRPLVLLCQLVLVSSSFCCAFADNFAWFMVARAFQGISASVYSVILAMVRDCFEDEAKRLAYTSMVVSMAVIGPLAAPMLGGLLASCFGWRSSFYTVAILSLLLFVVSVRVLEETAPPYKGGSYFASVGRVLLNGRRMLILASLGICKSYFDIIAAGSSFILQWHHQFNLVQSSFLTLFITVSGVVGIVISSLGGRTPNEVFQTFSALVILCSVMTFIAGVQDGNEFLFLGSLSVGTMMLYPPYLALLADFTCELQDIAGLATSFGTSVAQFLSFALSVPGMQLSGVGCRQMLFVLGSVLLAFQILCLALCHGAMAWKSIGGQAGLTDNPG